MLKQEEENFQGIIDQYLHDNGDKNAELDKEEINTITRLIIMIDHYKTKFVPYQADNDQLLKKFLQNFLNTIRDVKLLPDEFYLFWNEINNEPLILSNPEFKEEINEINEILTSKNKKPDVTQGRAKNFCSEQINESTSKICDLSLLDSSQLSIISQSTNVNFQNYEYYSLKNQISLEENIPEITDIEFSNEEEKKNNIVFNEKTKEIAEISINLLIKKLALDPNFQIKKESTGQNMDIINGFVQQYIFFISTESLVIKISKAVHYYLSNQENFNPDNLVSFLNLIVIKQYFNQIVFNESLKNKLHEIYTNLTKIPKILQNFEVKFNSIFPLIDSSDGSEVSYSFMELQGRARRSVQSLRTSKNSRVRNSVVSTLDVNFLDWEARDIAQELTLISSTLIGQIDNNEVLNYIQSKEETKKVRCPNLWKFIERFDKLSYFIIEEILAYDKRRNRAKIIQKFIEVEEELYKLNNFNDCMNIKSCLNHYIVRTLSQTWKLVDKNHMNIFNSLNTKFSFEKNFKIIREEIEYLARTNMAYIPYFGIVLRDLSFIKEGPKYINQQSKLINITKIKQVHEIVRQFFKFRDNSLLVHHITGLEILSKLNPKSEKELETIKGLLEPSFTLAKKKISVKRMTKTDISFAHKSKNYFLQKQAILQIGSWESQDSSFLFETGENEVETDNTFYDMKNQEKNRNIY